MKTEELQNIISWIRTTDLIEVSYHEGDQGFSLTSAQPPSMLPPAPASRLLAVTAPGVGVLRWGQPGRARRAVEGTTVALGETLGFVEGASGKPRPITTQCAGRIANIFAENDVPVEYGQPLLFIDPQS